MLTMTDVGRQLQQLQQRLLPYFHAAQKAEIQLLLAFMHSKVYSTQSNKSQKK